MGRREAQDTSSLASTAATAGPIGCTSHRHVYVTFLLLGGLVSLAFCGFVCVFGYYGEAVTAGIDRACAESAFQSGKRYEALGNLEDAARQYRLALVGRFGDTSHEHICRLSLGDVLVRLNRYEEAVEAYDQLHETAFDLSGKFTGYVTALARSGRLDKAERLGRLWLEMAHAENNGRQVIWASSTLGQLCEGAKRYDEAINFYGEASAVNPECEANVWMANVLRLQGRDREALALLDRFLTVAPTGQLRESAVHMRSEIAFTLRSPDAVSSYP